MGCSTELLRYILYNIILYKEKIENIHCFYIYVYMSILYLFNIISIREETWLSFKLSSFAYICTSVCICEYSLGDVIYGCRYSVYTYIVFGLSEGPLSYAFFFSLHIQFFLSSRLLLHGRPYIYVYIVYTVYIYIYMRKRRRVCRRVRAVGEDTKTHTYISVRRGELASRSIKGWPRGNSYSVQYSQWMISALTWLL